MDVAIDSLRAGQLAKFFDLTIGRLLAKLVGG